MLNFYLSKSLTIGSACLTLTVLVLAGCEKTTVPVPEKPKSVSVEPDTAKPDSEFAKAEVPKKTAEGWGTVTGQFIFDGPVPEKKARPVANAQQICTPTQHSDNDLVINPDNKGIQNIFVFLKRAKKVHPDLKVSKEKMVVFDHKDCTFVPHAMIVRTDQTVNVKSGDPVAHNVRTNPIRNEAVNFILTPNDRIGKDVENVIGEPIPTKVVCDIHPWMSAYWMILDHPYGVVSDKDGKFMIENLPEGKNEFRFWHEKIGYVDRKFIVDVKSEETVDLGQIKVSFD